MSRRVYSIGAVERAGPEFFARRDGVPRSARRVAGYLRSIFSAGMPSWDFDFAQVARGLGVSRRTVERAVAWLRKNDRALKFSTRRVGRSFAVRVSARQKAAPSLRTSLPRCRLRRKENTAGRVCATSGKLSKVGDAKLTRLACFIAKHELASLFWDNCKIRFRFSHAFNFARSALRRGFSCAMIVRAFERALIRRHGDATDCGLRRGCVVIFEPSSTVSLARTLLADGREDSERVAERLALLAPQKAENARFAERCRAELRALEAEPSAA